MPTASKAKAPRRRRTQQRSIDTRSKLLDAAAEEFAEYGFKGASTRRVAQAAGVEHSLIGYHFKTKDGLWRAVLRELNDRFITMYQGRLAGLHGVDVPTKLRLTLEDFVRFSVANPTYHWLMAHELNKGGARMNWLIEQYIGEFMKNIVDMVRETQAAGRFVAGDPHHLVYLFIGSACHICMHAAEVKRVSGRSPSTPAFTEEHVRQCLGLFFHEPDRR